MREKGLAATSGYRHALMEEILLEQLQKLMAIQYSIYALFYLSSHVKERYYCSKCFLADAH